jgi:hypothetical protein
MLVIPAAQEVEIEEVAVQGQSEQKVSETSSQIIKAERDGAQRSSQLCRKLK